MQLLARKNWEKRAKVLGLLEELQEHSAKAKSEEEQGPKEQEGN
jgi:hypothetical protein